MCVEHAGTMRDFEERLRHETDSPIFRSDAWGGGGSIRYQAQNLRKVQPPAATDS